MGTPRQPPCVPWPVQLRHACPLSGEAYVARSAWRDASLAVCPRHPRGGCGLVRHGTYPRRAPTGMRIARYYCPTAHETFSLLPDCLASRFPGELAAVEAVVAVVEAARSVEAAADVLRPDITLSSAVRWVRRRLTPVRRVLLAVVTLMPDLFMSDARLPRAPGAGHAVRVGGAADPRGAALGGPAHAARIPPPRRPARCAAVRGPTRDGGRPRRPRRVRIPLAAMLR